MTIKETSAESLESPYLDKDVQRYDLVCVLPHLGPGGAQKVALHVAKNWASKGYRVAILTTLTNPDDAHQVPAGVARLRLPSSGTTQPSLEPDVILSHHPAPIVRPYPGNPAPTSPFSSPLDKRRVSLSAALYLIGSASIKTLSLLAIASALTGGASRREEQLRRTVTWRCAALHLVEQECAQIHSARGAFEVGIQNVNRFISLVNRVARTKSFDKAVRRAAELAKKGEESAEIDPMSALSSAQKQRIEHIRQALCNARPQVVVAYLSQTNIATILAARDLQTKVVISERNDPSRQQLADPWETLRRLTYPQAHIVTANSQGAIDALAKFVPKDKLRLVPNPLELPDTDARPQRLPRVVCAARLVPQKAIDVAIRAFAQISDTIPEWELHILGDGPMRRELEAIAQASGVGHRVVFHGHVSDPYSHFLQARVFVLASIYEGMPNALLEAMACSCPAIVSDGSPGPLQFATHEETALVFRVNDHDALAAALTRLAEEPELGRSLAEAAKNRVAVLSQHASLDAWDALIRQSTDEDFVKTVEIRIP